MFNFQKRETRGIFLRQGRLQNAKRRRTSHVVPGQMTALMGALRRARKKCVLPFRRIRRGLSTRIKMRLPEATKNFGARFHIKRLDQPGSVSNSAANEITAE